jgi:glucarate dehydratase
VKISEVRVTPVAMRDPPLLNASGVHEPYALRSIVEVDTESGATGLGETYGDAPVLGALNAVKQDLAGLGVFDLAGVRARVAARVLEGHKSLAKVYGALETACLDAQARHLGLPLCELLGGAVRARVPYSAYLFFKYARHIDAPYPEDDWGEVLEEDALVREARTLVDRYGFGSLKLKAGALEPAIEARCLKALHTAFPAHPLRIDPNANWSLATALGIAAELGGILEYFEDPTPTLEGMAELHRASAVPLATNMVVTTFDEFRRNAALDAVQVILADHHYWGGLRATQQLAAMCHAFGIGVSMHSNSHLGISLMAMTHVAATIPNLSYACDTHYPWQTEDVVAGGRVPIVDGCVSIAAKPGLGVDLDRDALAAMHEQYRRCGIRKRDDAAQMRKYRPDFISQRPRY